MNYNTVYVGMDVHKESFTFCAYTIDAEKSSHFAISRLCLCINHLFPNDLFWLNQLSLSCRHSSVLS